MSDDTLIELLQELDAPQHQYAELERYYSGTQALAFLAPEARAALGGRFGRIASNIPRLAVNSLAERLRLTGFEGVDVWADWLNNDLDLWAPSLHREALLLGQAFAIVWGDGTGHPRVSVESAKQVAVITDPGLRTTVAAVKRWRTKTDTFAIKYLPDRIEKWHANTTGAATTAFNLVEQIDNPLGVVPVVPFVNTERILEPGRSEILDVLPLVDGLNKALADLLVTMEYVCRPRRWATGIELAETSVLDADGTPVLGDDGQPVREVVNPLSEDGPRMMVSENEATKFGQLPGADLAGYEAAVRIFLGQIQSVSALPGHYVGILTDQPASADAIRSSEASLTARAEARQRVFGRSWEQVANLMVAVRDGVDPVSVDAHVRWADAGTRSTAQEADAVTKLFQARLLSRRGALRRLGFNEDEISAELEQITDEMAADTAARSDPLYGNYLTALEGRLNA